MKYCTGFGAGNVDNTLVLHGAQVQRLIAVLSVAAVTRGALLADGAPDLAAQLSKEDAAVLRAAGWTASSGLRALLNFSGAAVPSEAVSRAVYFLPCTLK